MGQSEHDRVSLKVKEEFVSATEQYFNTIRRVFDQSLVSLKVDDFLMIIYDSYPENYEEDSNTPLGIVVKKSKLIKPEDGYDHLDE